MQINDKSWHIVQKGKVLDHQLFKIYFFASPMYLLTYNLFVLYDLCRLSCKLFEFPFSKLLFFIWGNFFIFEPFSESALETKTLGGDWWYLGLAASEEVTNFWINSFPANWTDYFKAEVSFSVLFLWREVNFFRGIELVRGFS